MYYLRLYELMVLEVGHIDAAMCLHDLTGPGFLNMVNRYYGYRIWR